MQHLEDISHQILFDNPVSFVVHAVMITVSILYSCIDNIIEVLVLIATIQLGPPAEK